MDPTAFASAIIQALGPLTVNAATAAVAAAAPPPPPPAPPRVSERIYTAKPEKYNGDRATYESFKRSIELYVATISTDKQKVLAALSFLTDGDADNWARNYTEINKSAIAADLVPWTQFIAALDLQFKDPREAEYARAAFVKLKMGDTPAHTFFLKVDEVRVKGELTDPAHHDRFVVEYLQRHMPAALVLAVSSAYEAKKRAAIDLVGILESLGTITAVQAANQRTTLDAPISYAVFREIAIQQDPNVRRFGNQNAAEAKHDRNPRGYPNAHRTYAAPVVHVHTPAPTAPAPSSSATEASATHSVSSRGPDVIPMEVDRNKHKGRKTCYNCGSPEHLSYNCPEDIKKFKVRELETDFLRLVLQEREEAEKVEEEETDEEDF